jgi:hypothetical protein
MLLALSAYFRVFIVSSKEALLGAMLAIMTVPASSPPPVRHKKRSEEEESKCAATASCWGMGG